MFGCDTPVDTPLLISFTQLGTVREMLTFESNEEDGFALLSCIIETCGEYVCDKLPFSIGQSSVSVFPQPAFNISSCNVT
jgi:hypothetical protein